MVKKKTTKKKTSPKAKSKSKKKTSVKRKTPAKKKPDQGLAIAALIINIVIPGVGSLIGGKTKEGVWQLVLAIGGPLIGLFLTLTIIGAIIGIPLLILAPLAAWIWGIVTGVQLIQESS